MKKSIVFSNYKLKIIKVFNVAVFSAYFAPSCKPFWMVQIHITQYKPVVFHFFPTNDFLF